MANTSFYGYLKEAFRFRVKNAGNKAITPETHFTYPGLRWNLSYKQIFDYARRLLPAVYKDLGDFPNTEEGNLLLARKVLEKLDRHQDIQLENQFRGTAVPESDEQILTEAQAMSAQATEQQALASGAPAAAGGFGLPSAGMSPSYGSRPVVIHNVPHAPETEKPEIIIANKGGVVAEKPPSEFHVTDKSGNITATYSKEPIPPAAQPKLVIAGSSGAVREAGEFSKLVTTQGGVIKEAPSSKIFIADRHDRIIKEQPIKYQSKFSALRSNIGSKVNIGLNKGINKAISGINNFGPGGGRGAGSRSFFGRIGGIGRGGKRTTSSIAKTAKRGKWILLLLGLMTLTGIIAFSGGSQPGTIPTGSTGTTTGSNISSCKFTRAGNPQLIKSTTLQGWITSAATAAGVPPQILASVAMHESQDFVANADNNHDAIKSGQYCNPGKIFCEDGKGHVLHSIDGQDDPCTTDEIINGARNAQAMGLMQLLDIYNPGQDLCSITNSLAIAAQKLKNDGITQQPTQSQINNAINSYYNSCKYGSYSYCDEVWTDYQNCQTAVATGGPALTSILNWDQQIVNSLSTGIWGLFNILATAITNGTYSTGTWSGTDINTAYYCTYSIIDSYNLAGISGLSRSAGHGAVVSMRQFWQSSQAGSLGYKFLDYSNNNGLLSSAQPGYVIFMESMPGITNGNEHAAMFKTISIDSRGNGYIITNDSNSSNISIKYEVAGWSIKNTPYTVTGIGGI